MYSSPVHTTLVASWQWRLDMLRARWRKPLVRHTSWHTSKRLIHPRLIPLARYLDRSATLLVMMNSLGL